MRNADAFGLNVIGVVSRREYRPRPNKVVLRMKPGTSKTASMPKSWADTVKGPMAIKRLAADPLPGQESQAGSATRVGQSFVPTLTRSAPPQTDFMAQLQAMIVAAVAPLQKEIIAIKEVMGQDPEAQSEAEMCEVDSECGEEQGDAADREAALAVGITDPANKPPRPKAARAGPY